MKTPIKRRPKRAATKRTKPKSIRHDPFHSEGGYFDYKLAAGLCRWDGAAHH